MQHSLTTGVRTPGLCRPASTSRVGAGRQQRAGRLLVRSVLDVNKKASANGAGKLDVAALESDIERELKYRLASSAKTDDKLYQSGGWACPRCRGARSAQRSPRVSALHLRNCMRRLPPMRRLP